MGNELFAGSRQSLEEQFIQRRDAATLAQRRAEDQRRAARGVLAAASRITDETLLDELVAFGIRADTLTALSLVPLVEVAWADGTVDAAEEHAILAAARAAGMAETSIGFRLLENCLSERPQAQLRNMWKEYIKNVCATLSPEEQDAFKTDLLRRARSVAEAASDFMDPGSNVSSKEEARLAEIAAAFEGAAGQTRF
jgi:hypothetical protein